MGKFLRCVEPEFKGAIERGTVSEVNAGDSPFDGGVQAVLVFRGGSGFEGEKGSTQAVREKLRCREDGGERIEIIAVLRIRCGQENVGGRQIIMKCLEEPGEAPGSDLLEHCWLSEAAKGLIGGLGTGRWRDGPTAASLWRGEVVEWRRGIVRFIWPSTAFHKFLRA